MRQERAERTRAALVLAAAAEFDQDGYERTTLTAVSRRASVSKGALSFHFTNKAELADTVQAAGCEAARAGLVRLRSRDMPALQVLVDMTHLITEQLETDQLVRAGVRLAAERDTDCSSAIHLFTAWCGAFHEVAADAEADRSLAEGQSPQSAERLAASLVSYAHVRHRRKDGQSRQHLTALWGVLLPWLAASGALPRIRPEGSGHADVGGGAEWSFRGDA